MPKILKSKPADSILRAASCALLAVCAAVFMLALVRYKVKPACMDVLPYPIAAVLVCWLLRGDYRARPVYWLAAAFALWFAATRFLCGEGRNPQSFYYIAEVLIIYAFVFPFAHASGDAERRRFLDGFALVFAAVITALCAVGLYAAVIGEDVFLFGGSHWTCLLWGRLWVLKLNPNVGSMFMVLALVLTVYLLLRYWRPWLLIPAVPMLLVIFLALAISMSRATWVCLMAAAAVMAAIAVAKLWKGRGYGRAAVMAASGAAALVLCYLALTLGVQTMNFAAAFYDRTQTPAATSENIPQPAEMELAARVTTQPVLSELSTEAAVEQRGMLGSNGRMTIYRAFFAYMKDHPVKLLRGSDMLSIRLMSVYGVQGEEREMTIHLHNAFFQMLAETGVPGLVMVLALCVVLLIRSLRILFDPKRSASEKMLPVLLLVLIVDSLVESPLFVPYDEATNSFFNLFFFLCAGYVAELGKKHGAEAPHNAIGVEN